MNRILNMNTIVRLLKYKTLRGGI